MSGLEQQFRKAQEREDNAAANVARLAQEKRRITDSLNEMNEKLRLARIELEKAIDAHGHAQKNRLALMSKLRSEGSK